MSQSTVIALAVFLLFLVYITARGRLPQYLAVFVGPVTSDTGSGSGSGALGTVQGALGTAQQAIGVVKQAQTVGTQLSNLTSSLDPYGSMGTGGL